MNYKEFKYPELEYFPRPLWFWNDKPTKETICEIMEKSKELTSYGGFGILPYDDCAKRLDKTIALISYR